MPQAAELLLDRFFVGGVGVQFQVTAKGRSCFRDAAEVQKRHATLLVLVGGFGISRQQEIQQTKSFVGGLGGEVDIAEVIDHPHHHRSAIHRGQHRSIESLHPRQSAAPIEIDQHTSMEGVDEGRVVTVVVLNDKVAWQSDSVHGLGQTTRHFHVDKREGNRDTQTGIQNPIQAAVLCRIVVGIVALKPEFSEQIGVGRFDEIATIGKIICTRGNLKRMSIQKLEILSRVQIRILDAGNFQRRHIQLHIGRFATEKIE